MYRLHGYPLTGLFNDTGYLFILLKKKTLLCCMGTIQHSGLYTNKITATHLGDSTITHKITVL